MEKNEKYLQQKRDYNSKLSTFQINRELHKKIKEYCYINNLKIREFIEKSLSMNLK